MMKRITIFVAAVFLVAVCAFTSFAMSVKITFSDPTVDIGQNVTVKMKINSESSDAIGKGKLTLSYDTAFLEFVSGTNATGGAGTLVVTGDSSLGTKEWAYEFTFKALQAGSTTLKIADKEIYDGSENVAEVSHAGSSAITINGEAGASVNANLSSLKINPGVLTPEFTPENTVYTAVVGESADKIAVSAPAADENAKVVISGNTELQMGENTIECKVTASDGSTSKSYIITVTKQEGEVDYGNAGLLTATVNGVDFEVIPSFDATLLPEDYTQTTFNYKGTDVQAGVKEGNPMVLMYLLGGDGSGDLYLYDPQNDSWAPYATINVAEKYITVVPLPDGVEIPEGFAGTTIELNGKKVRGWVWSSDPDQKYCIVYGMNADGETDFYRYDMKEKTIQRYFRDPAIEQVEEDHTREIELEAKVGSLEDQLKTQKLMTVVFGIIAGVLLIGIIIVLLLTRTKPGDDDYDEEEDDDGDDGEEENNRRNARGMRKNAQEEEMARREAYERQQAEERYLEEQRIREAEAEARAQAAVRPQPAPRPQTGGFSSFASEGISDEDIQKTLARGVKEVESKPSLPVDDDEFETFDL